MKNMVDIWYIQTVVDGILKPVPILKLEHRLHSPYEKSIMERAIEYVKDRREQFDDCYHCKEEN